MGWYDRIIPTVGDIEAKIASISDLILKMPGVTNLYIGGMYSENISKKDLPIREDDLIVKSSFNSGDLLAIEKGSHGPFSIPYENLEDEGFNPMAVKFTKRLIKTCDFKVDLWTISNDNKLLHWGPISDTVEEWKELRKQAAEKSEKITGFSSKKLNKASEQQLTEWMKTYEKEISSFITKGPLGWYESECSCTQELLKNSIRINS